MALKDVFLNEEEATKQKEQQQLLYEQYGLVENPFPSAAQTSDHPHMPIPADAEIDRAVKMFYDNRKSHAFAITATQGIGKTNLLNAYEKDLREVLSPRGFFVIRYMADPEPSFDPLIRSIFESFSENQLLYQSIKALAERQRSGVDLEDMLGIVRSVEVKRMLKALLEAESESDEKLKQRIQLAEQWLLGLPIRKNHQTELDVQFRLDTVESKTRVLRDIVYFTAALDTLKGIFLLLDEMEKQGSLKGIVTQYLSALRALIDSLPKYLFLMVASTPEALDRYREILPALKGRLANEIKLLPLQTEDEALELMNFYLEQGRTQAAVLAQQKGWGESRKADLVEEADARRLFNESLKSGLTKGVRQREYLDALHRQADLKIAS